MSVKCNHSEEVYDGAPFYGNSAVRQRRNALGEILMTSNAKEQKKKKKDLLSQRWEVRWWVQGCSLNRKGESREMRL
ncbi:hypothetical protein CEXT_645951 [Caerostris extrusa]|uniref:Uncharacterized protein n=1 Tax=Caerostris extrusa TaxID=172846 RepID=A0AAV4MF10_CAEEX|nr:hypothetical protein CEXT_645951 [Caerostris extrusa]